MFSTAKSSQCFWLFEIQLIKPHLRRSWNTNSKRLLCPWHPAHHSYFDSLVAQSTFQMYVRQAPVSAGVYHTLLKCQLAVGIFKLVTWRRLSSNHYKVLHFYFAGMFPISSPVLIIWIYIFLIDVLGYLS